MTALTRWQGSTDPADESGTATLVIGERVLQLRLRSFKDAQALDEFIDRATLRARQESRRAVSAWLRGAADQLGVA